MSDNEKGKGIIFYRLPLDEEGDNDLIEWINTLPRNKKAEVIRHALRHYQRHLSEGELFYYAPFGSVVHTVPVVMEKKEKKPEKHESAEPPPKGLLGKFKNPV